jgi:hypothetical protein
MADRLRRQTSGRRRDPRAGTVLPLLALALIASPLQAQVGDFQTRCLNAGGLTLECAAAAEVAGIAPLRALVLGAGGSPVAGSASTLGQRLPGSPRWAFTIRMTRAGMGLPDATSQGTSLDGTGSGWNADLAVGVIDGIPTFETVGGVGSVDLLVSLGTINLPSDAGFRTRSPFTFGAGARVGIVRESFTVPGISVSAMYRRIGAFSAGQALQPPGGAQSSGAHVRADGTSAWSLRAGIGKRIALFGVTAGLGWDRTSSDIAADVAAGAGTVSVEDNGFTSSSSMVYGGLLWTRLVYGLSAEFGWQRANGAIEDGRTPSSDAQGGGFFLSLAGRIVI